jgi:superfamily II DNA or RNA helicase
MLGRGLRKAPGKDNCLVLDFTDKQHKVDRIIDLRVLLPDDGYKNLDPNWQPPEVKDKARKLKLEGQEGGEMSVLGEEVDPYDMAFVSYKLLVTVEAIM